MLVIRYTIAAIQALDFSCLTGMFYMINILCRKQDVIFDIVFAIKKNYINL